MEKQFDSATILTVLEKRFTTNTERHVDILWEAIRVKLQSNPDKLRSLFEMEKTGGEPDVIGYDKEEDEYWFVDCSTETPVERRNLCYDSEAQISRKGGGAPAGNAVATAEAMGIELLTEEQYRLLQSFGKFDTKTSSWLKTPENIRKLGGAIFGDKRYNTTFIYHNGASSYYSSRGFRGLLRV